MVSQSMKQRTFADLEQAHKKKVTRREKFLAEMDAVIPWSRLEALIAPHYPKPKAGKPGRRPLSLATKLRIYCLQQFYGLSDPGAEEALYDSDAMRRFAGITLTDEAVPDESTILQFRRLLERHGLAEQIFAEVNAHLRERGLMLREGTLVDATLIHAPSSTKNQSGTRDPDMSQTRKGNQWYFGCKAHIGADAHSGLVHTVIGTTAKVADITKTEALLHGEERIVLGDAGYRRTGRSLDAPAPDRGPRIVTPYVRSAGKALLEWQRAANRRLASLRARVEHPFRIVKCQFGYTKVRYRGLTKNTAHLHSLFAMANLVAARRQLLAAG